MWRQRLNAPARVLAVWLAALLMTLAAAAANASSPPDTVSPAGESGGATPAAVPARPRICLALSGGGARGYAHLGVLKELEALHVPVDCIAGTSMGAVIGALYASGMNADAIEQALSGQNLSDVAFDRDARSDLPESSREDNLMYPIGLPMGFGGGHLRTSNGLVQGNQLMALLRTHTGQYPGDIDFDRLPIPFRAVATDLETGERVVLHDGSLPLAVRASMAVPGLFAPVKIGERTLIDGGTASNLPIDVAREMGADIVIAVDIGTQLQRADQLNSMAAVTAQMVRLMMSRNVTAQKATLRASDILLEPDLGSLSFTDFGAMQRAVQAGDAAAIQQRERLAALSDGPQQYAVWRANLSQAAALPPATRIARIEVSTRGRLPASHVEAALRVKPGDVYDAPSVDADLARLARTDDLESVSQTLTGPPGERVLHVEANEKSWGPNFLLFGLGLSTNFDGDGAFSLQIGHRLPWITASGLSWRNDIILGSRDLGWRTELRQPIFGQVYLAPYASIRRNDANFYADNGVRERPLATFVQQNLRVGLDVGVPLGNWGEARAGVAQVRTSFQARSSVLALDGQGQAQTETPSLSPTTQTVASAGVRIDQLDDPVFPRHGFHLEGRAEMGLGGSDSGYNIAYARGLWAASHDIFSLNAAFEMGGAFGSSRDAPTYLFTLGGFQHLSAYAQDQFSGAYIAYARVSGLAQLSRDGSGPLRGIFTGVSLEGGNVWNTSKQFARGPWLSSASTFVGAVTAIGPVYFGVAMAPRGAHSVYFQLGNRF
ncbi:NTE family protein [Paraburkholderia bannensis]|uniref:NTE family protein n=1 Tax=Paraburkholderia bannensis TaxID=765414 RepID=A0A7W9WXB7_9BURK|nr:MULTISPECIES: patatin-like phospholipase family protein [Paraburkholderia]MBB3262084.1 NTE family protein [Paraburkholderia sp. WP4_3_2]MBB6107083.1 NTE family protein [Paraburkholderia bannensis]